MDQLNATTIEMDIVVEKQLGKRNVFLNHTKEQSIGRYYGNLSMTAKAQFYTEQLHYSDDNLQHLGLQLGEGGRCQVEVAMRIQESQVAWDHYKGFWA